MDNRRSPEVGDIVLYNLGPVDYGPEHVWRPAIIVRVWSPGSPSSACQLQVFTDGTNDGAGYASGLEWATSRVQGYGIGNFRYADDPVPADQSLAVAQ